jgi:hypothetical protein
MDRLTKQSDQENRFYYEPRCIEAGRWDGLIEYQTEG